jgi:hypothetical protein
MYLFTARKCCNVSKFNTLVDQTIAVWYSNSNTFRDNTLRNMVPTYQTTRPNIPEDGNINIYLCENLTYNTALILSFYKYRSILKGFDDGV